MTFAPVRRSSRESRGSSSTLEPVGRMLQLRVSGAEFPPLVALLSFLGDLGHHHDQHLLVNINSRYGIGHLLFSFGGAESVPKLSYAGSRGYRRSPGGGALTPIYALKRARSGSDLPTLSTSPLPTRPRRYHHSVVCRTRFHEIARAAGAKKTYRKLVRFVRVVGHPVQNSCCDE